MPGRHRKVSRIVSHGKWHVRFLFVEEPWTALYGRVRIELHEHRQLFPEAPFALEPFGESPDGTLWHYSGDRFVEPIDQEEFIERALRLLDQLAREHDLEL